MNYSVIVVMYGFMIFSIFMGSICLFIKKHYDGGFMMLTCGAACCLLNIMVDMSDEVNSSTFTFVLDAIFCALVSFGAMWAEWKNIKDKKARNAWLTETGTTTVIELKEHLDELIQYGHGGCKVVMFDGLTYHHVGRNIGVGKDAIYLG